MTCDLLHAKKMALPLHTAPRRHFLCQLSSQSSGCTKSARPLGRCANIVCLSVWNLPPLYRTSAPTAILFKVTATEYCVFPGECVVGGENDIKIADGQQYRALAMHPFRFFEFAALRTMPLMESSQCRSLTINS